MGVGKMNEARRVEKRDCETRNLGMANLHYFR